MSVYFPAVRRVGFIPLDWTAFSIQAVSNLMKSLPHLVSGGKDVAQEKPPVLQLIFDPLIKIEKVRTRSSARNRDLNPVGLKRNIRQNFGMDSRKITIDGYISPLSFSSGDAFVDYSNANVKVNILKHLQLHQIRIMVMWNSDWDIITIDEIDYEELADEPFVYGISLKCTSLRVYDGYKDFLKSIGNDLIINGLVGSVMATSPVF